MQLLARNPACPCVFPLTAMPSIPFKTPGRLHRSLFASLLLAASIAAAVATGASAERAKLLGKTARTPEPNCPNNCFAVGSVTGFQVTAGGKRQLFRMPEDGRVVGWSVDLSRPTKSQRNFFGDVFGNDRFGRAPTARISVLKKIDRNTFKLTKQSPVMNLRSELGETPIFTLNDPFTARKGRILAITVPTWAAILNVRQGAEDRRWRASRRKGECGENQATDARPHQKVGSKREYGCSFTDRLLYWVYYAKA